MKSIDHKSRYKVMARANIIPLIMIALAASASSALAQDAADPGSAAPAIMTTPLEKSRQAIEECRERRLRGELSSYKESAECSSPKIFAAWREAGYTHMDLITAWVSAREDASAKVDQKVITAAEFERQMGELTIRLTAEEKRRIAGLVRTADSSLELELPTPTRVIGVVPPPGKDKLTKQKTQAARVAASRQNAEGASGANVQSLTLLSAAESKRNTTAGVGGPYVPVPENMRPKSSISAQGASGLYAHLSSQRSETDARFAYRSLQQKYPEILGGRDAVIRRSDDASQGTFYRVEVGPFERGKADEFCNSLRSSGGQCVPQYE
jgi:hypothetical protein